ncbi:MAG: ferrous iron transport protein B [Oscillospiraceae bacterium]|nr:ferrous iron transport protein B [Oscillospiraceae bacterium]
MTFALAGNQNCGKTTLFNQFTGSNQHVGNFPGVTVERKTGVLIGYKNISVVDLPGIYSLTSYTREEIVSRDFLLKEKPDCIINIIDATNIERNLYLTMQLIELQIPMVLALNMMDEVQANEGFIDVAGLKKQLGIPVVPISAAKKHGLSELTEQAVNIAKYRQKPMRIDFCPKGAVHRAVHAVSHLIEDHALKFDVPVRFAATKILEGDQKVTEQLCLDDNEKDMLDHAALEMEQELGTDREAAIIDMRYNFIGQLCSRCVTKPVESREYRRSVRIDKVLTGKFLAFPAFFGIMLIVFWLTFGVIGTPLSGLVETGIELISTAADKAFTAYGLSPAIHSLIIDGIFTGVGAVLGFIPIVVTLFFFMSILEDSGYMARIAFIMDKPLRKIGLSGRSFVPMLIGFGCTVPAIMATRTLTGERDKKMTILLTPFMSCSAKIPIYALFTAVFFPEHAVAVMIGLYLAGMILGVISAFVMSRTVYKGAPVPFVLELPNYRFPSAKSILRLMWDKSKDFLQRAFTVIFIASIVIWFLQSFDTRLSIVTDSTKSILAGIGQKISGIFVPLGFADWRVTTSLLTGFIAKESVISTLAVLGGDIQTMFTGLSALSFLVFTLLYTPCIAAAATVKREFGSIKGTLFVVIYQTAFAWVCAFLVYQIGRLIAV